MGTKLNVPADLQREIVEGELIEAFHWLPQEIAKIPYRKLQKLFMIRKEKDEVRHTKSSMEAFKAQHSGTSSGGKRSYTREV